MENPTVPQMPAASPAARLGFQEGLRKAYALYKQGWKPLVAMMVIGVLLAAVTAVALGGAAIVSKTAGPAATLVFRAIAIAVVVAAIAAQFWISVAYLMLIQGGGTVRATLERSKTLVWPFFVTSFLSGLVVFGGGLLIIPAIVWSVSFAVLPWVVVGEGLRGHAALLKARRLVHGDGWWLFFMQVGAVIVAGVIPALLQIPVDRLPEGSFAAVALTAVIGAVQGFVLGPIVTIFGYLLYKDLVARKAGKLPELPKTAGRFKVAAWAGVIVLAFAAFAVMNVAMR